MGKGARWWLVVLVSAGVCGLPAGAATRAGGIFDCGAIVAQAPLADVSAIKARLIGAQVDMTRIKESLERLTGEKPLLLSYKTPDRYTEANRELIRLYIIYYLSNLGLKVVTEPFPEGLNFWVEIAGTESPNEVFEVTSHYDSEDAEVPGADDNGSGIALLMEMAKLFRKHKPKKTIRLVFMDREEQGLQGSLAHAKGVREEFFPKKKIEEPEPVQSPRRFLGSLVVDMIGYSPKPVEKQNMVVLEVGEETEYGYAYGEREKAERAAAYAMSLSCAKDICRQFLRFADPDGKRQYKEGEVSESLKLSVDVKTAKAGTADHGSYWQSALPALLLAAPYERGYVNPFNHRRGDTISNMNWTYYTRVARLAVEAVAVVTGAEPALPDNAATLRLIAAITGEENTALSREEDPVKKLEKPAEPRSRWGWGSWRDDEDDDDRDSDGVKLTEKHLLVVESDYSRGDLIDTDAHDKFISSRSAMRAMGTKAREAKVLVLRKLGSGIVGRAEVETLAAWLKRYNDAGRWSKPSPPTGFDWAESRWPSSSY